MTKPGKWTADYRKLKVGQLVQFGWANGFEYMWDRSVVNKRRRNHTAHLKSHKWNEPVRFRVIAKDLV